MTMREITEHHVNACNKAIQILAVDEPDNSGASSRYEVYLPAREGKSPRCAAELGFQRGAISEPLAESVNGITHEALLAILIDRMRGFQIGPFACEENRMALMSLEVGQAWLRSRTEKREARGVEGTHQP
jgi:hypothetical protein